jgi:hypothetical protein
MLYPIILAMWQNTRWPGPSIYIWNILVALLVPGSLRERNHWGDQGDNIKMDLQEVGVGGGDWMKLAEDRDLWVR